MDINYKHGQFNSIQEFEEMCDFARHYPEKFWKKIAIESLDWFEEPSKILPEDDALISGNIEWFKNGKLNASYECLDANLKKGYKNRIAYAWEPNHPTAAGGEYYTYQQLYERVNRLTNILRSHGIKKGDRICIYLQMIIDLPVAMLACARIGAIHAVVFGGFSSQSLASRIDDLECTAVITQDTGHRGEKYHIPMKQIVDDALKLCSTNVEKVFVVDYTGAKINRCSRDIILSEESGGTQYSEFEVMDAEDPLFVLYTSGSTGKPKGVLHTTGGYLVNAVYTHKIVYDCKENDLQWICADIGWSTGHTYCVYAPLINRTTNLIFEGSILYPDPSRIWEIIDRYKVNRFQIAPTGLRLLLKYGDKPLDGINLDSLDLIGSVGEPIKEPEWKWLYEKIGKKKCPVIDTWWQTETGACQLSPIPGITPSRPGSLGYPLPGCDLVLIEDFKQGIATKIVGDDAEGSLYIETVPPSIMRTVYNDHKRFKKTYLNGNPGYFVTGDRAKRDEDGMYQVLGREDDTIQVSGILIGTAEVEGAIQQIANVTEAAVVGYNHAIKGECVLAYVVMKDGIDSNSPNYSSIKIKAHVKKSIGSFAVPEIIIVVDELPKTRSGKIMRRILREIGQDAKVSGDISTLLNPECVEKILDLRNETSMLN